MPHVGNLRAVPRPLGQPQFQQAAQTAQVAIDPHQLPDGIQVRQAADRFIEAERGQKRGHRHPGTRGAGHDLFPLLGRDVDLQRARSVTRGVDASVYGGVSPSRPLPRSVSESVIPSSHRRVRGGIGRLHRLRCGTTMHILPSGRRRRNASIGADLRESATGCEPGG